MNHAQPFRFSTERRLIVLTGLSARNLRELAAVLKTVSGSSIFYHTHHQYLAHHFQSPIVYNDFASWVFQALQEDSLGEKLAAVDLLAFTTVRKLREAILELIEARLQEDGNLRECPPGNEFHFCKSKSFVMPTGIVARNPVEFFVKLPAVTHGSLYFHFFEARLRLKHTTNDFSNWLRSQGQAKLADAINELDPYSRTLDELKEEILELGFKYGVH